MNEIQETSREAIKSIDLETRQRKVYDAIKLIGPCNNLEISKELGIPINQVTGRVNELRNIKKVVGFDRKDICPITNRLVMFWKVVKEW